MSYYSEASLVMIPSGVKDGKVYSAKPVDGSGDFTFSRGSDIEATRVAANGYIQKAAVNLLLQSNTFDTTWTTTDSSVTSGQTGYDGSSDAWLLSKSAAGGDINQTGLSVSGLQTFSLYAKAGTSTWISMTILGGSNPRTSFDLVNGVVGTLLGSAVSAKIESVGNGWYRCSIVGNVTSTGVYIYPSEGDGVTSGTTGNILIQDAQLNYGLVAQEYQETTTTSVVSGITNDMPRLDYSGGASCPSLLLEPSRTNLIPQSEYIADWSQTNATTSSNQSTSPEGVNNASLSTATGTGAHAPFDTLAGSVTSGANYTMSIFYKKGTTNYLRFEDGYTGIGIDIDIDAESATPRNGATNANIEDYGNSWYRASFGFTGHGSGASQIVVYIKNSSDQTSYTASGENVYLYGAQLEAGSYPTSLIPTYGTSATRTEDNTIINPSSLVGATQGSWFFELDDLSFEVTGTSVPTNWIGYNVSNCLAIECRANNQPKNIYFVKEENNVVTTLATKEISTTLKACFVWNGTSLKCFVDGEKVYDAGGFTQPIAWSTFEFNSSGREAQQTLKQTLLFPTAISDADAIALTA
jgi:hypothetical protein